MSSRMIETIHTEGGVPDILGQWIPTETIIGIYDAEAAIRTSFSARDYAALQMMVGEALAADLAAQAGWSV